MGYEILKTAEERGFEKGEDQMLKAINLINDGYKTVQDLVLRGISQRTAEKALGAYSRPI